VDPGERTFFNSDAYKAIVHTANHISEPNKDFLRELPLMYDSNESFIGVHSSPSNPASWGYILDAWEVADAFQCMHKPIAFTGHSHIACIITEASEVRPLNPGDKIKLNQNKKFIVNVGSVGQPRDRDPRATFILFDDDQNTIQFFRIEYNWEKTAEKIIKAGLPQTLAHRITVGL
jgi:diadenosine tetraphosphatase ApaH/serine/threonine PP2A family protein phosphatase